MFKRIDHLNRHARLVHDKTPFECPVCAKVFFWNEKEKERLLNEHTQAVHLGYKPFVCEICGKKMSKYRNWIKSGVAAIIDGFLKKFSNKDSK